MRLHCQENKRQWLTVDKDGDEIILNIFSGEAGVEVPVVLTKEQAKELANELNN